MNWVSRLWDATSLCVKVPTELTFIQGPNRLPLPTQRLDQRDQGVDLGALDLSL
jgi:hypothetical protein